MIRKSLDKIALSENRLETSLSKRNSKVLRLQNWAGYTIAIFLSMPIVGMVLSHGLSSSLQMEIESLGISSILGKVSLGLTCLGLALLIFIGVIGNAYEKVIIENANDGLVITEGGKRKCYDCQLITNLNINNEEKGQFEVVFEYGNSKLI
ncbi:MAG: hypothetical protein ACI85I_002691 [Arenicella sp.]|jgi:hypothetical protein